MAMFRCPGLHCDGCGDGGGLASILALVPAALAAVAVAVFVLAHLVAIAAGVAVLAVVTLAAVLFLRRFMVVDWAPRRVPAALPVPATALPVPAAEAVSAPRRAAIEAPAQHLHIHVHGLAPEDAAAVIRQAVPARLAVDDRRV
jgi:hypothetical protein